MLLLLITIFHITTAGVASMTCINGRWDPDQFGVCKTNVSYAQGCPDIMAPRNGCYKRTGTSTCVSGAWHPQSVGECSNTPSLDTPKLCHPLNAPYNGTVSLSKGSPDFPAENGVVAMLVCKPGTFVLGSTTSLCTGGTWIPSTLGTCNSNANSGGVETGCNWMFAPHGMFLNWSNINFGGPILNGTQLTANCVNRASCPPMTASSPDVGLIYRSGNRYMLGAAQDKLDHGTLLTVKCYNGTMRGNNVATCADGKWYPSTIGGCFR
ncbi:hypothetical protein Y032_0011g1298 [Ancylostoma ceylanicum]|uniref:Sushi domain-containing protein n=1 Tax=Ancylostoma ceylanicum TaxID=53326 RepID=A0A016VEB9_9BILA|nr:hypothetical protein Y032_0011g1298 [Ancylostoma ceylanicum]